jgi:REP element-mobilizing transposase RayT
LRRPLGVGTVEDMPRKPRIEIVGSVYHVTQHGIDEQAIFRTDPDRERFLTYLLDEVGRSEWQCLAYSLMRTHYHLLIRLTKLTLSSGFQRLNGRYAASFNRTHGRRGHVFERRFRDVIVESEAHRYEVTRYIHLNAPRANACARPEDHVWCDYAATMGLVGPDPVVDPRLALELFGKDLRSARRAYLRFLGEPDQRVRRGQTRVRPRR